MKFSTTSTSINNMAQGRLGSIPLTYRGASPSNVPVELFIDGVTNKRIVPEPRSAGYIVARAVRFNNLSGQVAAATFQVIYQVDAAGVITLVDQDSVTAGTQDNVLVAVTTAGTRAGNVNMGNVDNGVYVEVVPAAGTVPAYLRMMVRGFSGQPLSWEVHVDALEITPGLN